MVKNRRGSAAKIEVSKFAVKEKNEKEIKELDPLVSIGDSIKKFWDDPKVVFRKRVLS